MNNNTMKSLVNIIYFITTSLTIKRVLSFKRIMSSSSSHSLSSNSLSSLSLSPSSSLRNSLEQLTFDNRNIQSLPIDNEKRIFNRKVSGAIFSLVHPKPVVNPSIIAISEDAFELLGLKNIKEDDVVKYLSGNEILSNSIPAAHCYCGHQFGTFVGQLGDGAAMYLGEIINNENGNRWELQLKGAGPTPYSRAADGRKVLRSSVREFLCSEGMHFLNIPTTRSASCVTSDSTVERDPFYDGNSIAEKCTIISRIAQNFFRFGSFEIFKSESTSDKVGPSAGNNILKKQFLDYILLYYPDIMKKYENNEHSNEIMKYKDFFTEIMNRTIKLVVKWQCVGFVHGVLNTDNMSIMGATIDYGPFGFMENFDKDFVPNGSDSGGRYCYQKQPEICKWNLLKLAEVLDPILPLQDSMDILKEYDSLYDAYYMEEMRKKLGLLSILEGDRELVDDLFNTIDTTSTDFTDTFQALTDYVSSSKSSDDFNVLVSKLVSRSTNPTEQIGIIIIIINHSYHHHHYYYYESSIGALRRKMKIHRLQMHPAQIEQLWALLQANATEVSEIFSGAPVEEIRAEILVEKNKLDKLVSISKEIKRLESVSAQSKEADDRHLLEIWSKKYIQRINDDDNDNTDRNSLRITTMSNHNPSFILRNWIAQDAIKDAEAGDYSKVRLVLSLLKTPFDRRFNTFNNNYDGDSRYFTKTPSSASSLICTCSS